MSHHISDKHTYMRADALKHTHTHTSYRHTQRHTHTHSANELTQHCQAETGNRANWFPITGAIWNSNKNHNWANSCPRCCRTAPGKLNQPDSHQNAFLLRQEDLRSFLEMLCSLKPLKQHFPLVLESPFRPS